MSGGYAAFSSCYSFMCLSDDETLARVESAHFIWPIEILPNRLYLCAEHEMKVDNCNQMYAALSIQHIIDLTVDGLKYSTDDMQNVSITHLCPVHVDQTVPLLDGIEVFNQAGGAVLLCCEEGVVKGPTLAVGNKICRQPAVMTG